MPLRILCRGCQRSLRISERCVGKSIKCPHCAHRMILKKKTTPATPLAQAKVVLIGENGEVGPFAAKTDHEGRFVIRSNTNRGIPRGKYKVTVSKIALEDGTIPQGEELQNALRSGMMQNIVPKRY